MGLPYRRNGSVVARRSDKFLLVRKPRARHAWQFPQGGCEAGEDFLAAAMREFEEEIGTSQIEIVGDEIGVYRYDWPSDVTIDERLQKFRGQEVHFFLADFLGSDSDIHLDAAELAEYRWVTQEELGALVESSAYLQTIFPK